MATVSLSGMDELRGVTLSGLDLSGATWESLRLLDVRVEDCVFDDARLPDLRMWESRWTDCSMRGTRLNGGSMAGRTPVWRRRGSTQWAGVDFTGADLRDTAHGGELYTGCDFSHARLESVDFSDARHVRSRFAGVLREVFFYRRAPQSSRLRPVNEMRDVDLTAARLTDCSFFGLDLASARLPSAALHVIALGKVPVARRVLALMTSTGTLESMIGLRVAMEYWIEEGPDTPTAWGIADRASLGESDEERNRALALVERAQRESAPIPR
ncbi:pentapeptide repeat-containing protein [Cellulomonas sp. 179-A 4D5 NHS]|uniref:pentapeptide repeat-containing protein n=1 Tax=Cellulomonas sp. 179-A 4D5 NHS TaxID=3142378 RepID=UPI0039A39336